MCRKDSSQDFIGPNFGTRNTGRLGVVSLLAGSVMREVLSVARATHLQVEESDTNR